MTISMQTIRAFNETKSSIQTAIQYGIGKYTQKDMHEKSQQWIDNFINRAPKRTPKVLFSELCAYRDGFLDAMIEGKTIFLYNVEGKFYKTSHSQGIELPEWRELPRDQWGTLGEHGGIYWKETLNVYFK